ncbi:hypothetical protein GKE82_14250 [Conexibacter sp. W3-3-2]|nr:hypothetical protein [Conexibacter sp. W3-3-2]
MLQRRTARFLAVDGDLAPADVVAQVPGAPSDHRVVLRAGIIGAGAAGHAHAHAVNALPADLVRVVGVHDADLERALALAGATWAEPFRDLGELCAAVDLVVVCSPTEDHAAHVLRAAAAGCDVLVERPVVPRAQDLARLHAHVARAPRRIVAQAGHAALHDPLLRVLVRALAPYQPATVELRFETPRVPGAPSVVEILHDALTVLHPLTRSAPAQIHASARRRRSGGGLEHVTALVTTDSGVLATLHVGHLCDRPTKLARVVTDRVVVEASGDTGEVVVHPRGDDGEVVVHPAGQEDALVAQARSFVSAVGSRAVPAVPLSAALPALELTEKVLRHVDLGERLGSGRRAA